MTTAQRTRLRELLAGGMFFPEARDLAQLMVRIDDREQARAEHPRERECACDLCRQRRELEVRR